MATLVLLGEYFFMAFDKLCNKCILCNNIPIENELKLYVVFDSKTHAHICDKCTLTDRRLISRLKYNRKCLGCLCKLTGDSKMFNGISLCKNCCENKFLVDKIKLFTPFC